MTTSDWSPPIPGMSERTFSHLGIATDLMLQGKHDAARAGGLFQKVANQNTLPALNYSFVRAKAKRMRA